MFKFWKTQNKPDKFLSKIVDDLTEMSNKEKYGFLIENIQDIKDAMKKTGAYTPSHDNDLPETPQNILSTDAGALRYLDWHRTILTTLHNDDGELLNTSRLSSSAQYFMDETKEDTAFTLRSLFKRKPVDAIKCSPPVGLFQPELLGAMESLLNHEDPQLYFECLDNINDRDDQADLTGFQVRLQALTHMALSRLLVERPNLLLFPSTEPDNRSRKKESHLFSLPHPAAIKSFIHDNIDQVYDAVRAVAGNPSNGYLTDFNKICAVFPAKERLPQLTELKKLLLPEHIKMCFRLAANGKPDALSQPVLALDDQQTYLVKIFSYYKEGNLSPAYDLLRLTEPSSIADPETQYLWMVRKEDKVLAAAFSKAGISTYLETQTQFTSDELPTVAQWKNWIVDSTEPFGPPTMKK